jgi:hypothetical protein
MFHVIETEKRISANLKSNFPGRRKGFEMNFLLSTKPFSLFKQAKISYLNFFIK